MKKLLFLIVPLFGYGQYSTYYGTYNVNANINQNVNVSGNINKTINTIDYGALANANATRERNRIEALKATTDRDKEALLAIADNPINAYVYGEKFEYYVDKKTLKEFGLRKLKVSVTMPHKGLFSLSGAGNYHNLSDDFITAEYYLTLPYNFNVFQKRLKKENIDRFDKYSSILNNVEEYSKRRDLIVGEFNEKYKFFVHKKDLSRANVNGKNGFKHTVVSEDDYEIKIEDTYIAVSDGLVYMADFTVKADKNEVSFEQLEGRRYYLRKVVEKIIASAYFTEIKK